MSKLEPLEFSTFDDCLIQEGAEPPKQWLIKNVIAEEEDSTWYAPPGSGKSALLTDLAFNVAAGTDWRGYKTPSSGGVIIFALERAELTKRRLAAYGIKHKDKLFDKFPLVIVDKMINLLDPKCVDQIDSCMRKVEYRLDCTVRLLIFDTWSKGLALGGGDEDKAKDQNLAATHLKLIHERNCCLHIATIGHPGKDESRGERGSNARLGHVDLAVQISGDTVRTATVVKANDQAEGVLTSFTMEGIEIGKDEDGDPITVGIVSADTPAAAPKAKSRLTDKQARALDALKRAIKEHGQGDTVDINHWRDEMFRSGQLDQSAANPRQDFKRLRDALARTERITERDGFVRIGHHDHMVSQPSSNLPPLPA